MDTVNLICTMIQAGCVLSATIFGFFTVNTWMKERRYDRQVSVISDAMFLAFQARDAIKQIRNPAGWTGEGEKRPKYDKETEDNKREVDGAYTPIARLMRHEELFVKMSTHRYNMMMEFGDAQEDCFKEALDFTSNLYNAAIIQIDLILSRRPGRELDEWEKKHYVEFQALRWGHRPEDPINMGLDAMISRLKTLMHKVRRGDHTKR